MTTTRYRIVIDSGRETRIGSSLLDIAHSYIDDNGRVISTTPRYDGEHDLVLIEVEADATTYLETCLDADDRVLTYAEAQMDYRLRNRDGLALLDVALEWKKRFKGKGWQ